MSGTKRFSNHLEAIKVTQEIYDTYDFVPSFAVATATTDYDLKTQQATAFANVTKAATILLWTDQDISIKFNDTGKPAITLSAGDSPFEFKDVLKITNVFITNNSGNTANIKVLLI